MARKYRMLVAVAPPAVMILDRTLSEYLRLLPVYTMAQATSSLESDDEIDAILCGVLFDGSRMLDLLRWARQRVPALPFVCCRMLDYETPPIPIEALSTAALSFGAAAFIDLPALAHKHGQSAADAEFRSLLLAQLRPLPS